MTATTMQSRVQELLDEFDQAASREAETVQRMEDAQRKISNARAKRRLAQDLEGTALNANVKKDEYQRLIADAKSARAEAGTLRREGSDELSDARSQLAGVRKDRERLATATREAVEKAMNEIAQSHGLLNGRSAAEK